MCYSNDEHCLLIMKSLKTPLKDKLGNGYEDNAIGSGVVMQKCPLPSGISN